MAKQNGDHGDNGERTIGEAVYGKLKSDIVGCVLMPNERLRFDALRRRYRTSVSSLREALSRLITEGLVMVESHKGARVAGVWEDDLADLVRVRKVIETQAIQRAIECGDDRWEADIVAAFHLYEASLKGKSQRRAGDAERIARHNRFHSALLAACDSPRLLTIRGVLYAQAERYLMLGFRMARLDDEKVMAEHERLMAAVLARKPRLACALVEDHIERAAADIFPIVRNLAAQAGRAPVASATPRAS
jgi:GntR family transcriptional regulator, carbon starvation induced regulator